STQNSPRVKSRKRPARSVRWLVRPTEAVRLGVILIREGKKEDAYLVRRMPSAIGEGWAVTKWATGATYHVNLDRERGHDHQCDCDGWSWRGRCRHVLGLLALPPVDVADPDLEVIDLGAPAVADADLATADPAFPEWLSVSFRQACKR